MVLAVKVNASISAWDTIRFVRLANGVQDRFRFSGEEGNEQAVSVRITETPSDDLFGADRHGGVTISAWQSDGICHYLGIQRESYFVVASMLGLTHWITLVRHPMLIAEDLIHESPGRCIFAKARTIQDYCLLLESPHVCNDCLDFYRCLGAELEIEALLRALRRLGRAQQPGMVPTCTEALPRTLF